MGKDGFENMMKYLDDHGLSMNRVLSDLADGLFDIMIFQDTEFNSIWISNLHQLTKKYNKNLDQIYNEMCYEIFFGRDSVCLSCPVEKARKSGEPEESEIRDAQGNIYLVRVYPIQDDTGEIIGFFKVLLEITQRKRLEKKLAVEQNKTEFFTSLSHEFRTPLNLMHTSLQLFEAQFAKFDEKSKIKNKLRNYLNIIEQNNYRLLKLVNNLLDINKMDLGKYDLSLQNRNIVDNLKYIVKSSKEIAERQDKTLSFETDIQYKIIAFDPFEIERILLNLISNAFKFTEPGDEIVVRFKESDKEVIIEVEDTGIGIPDDKQDHIFEKFSQADTPHHKQGEGSGLGLSIVKVIAEMHGGKVELESKPGDGSTFILRLPDRKVPESMVSEYHKNANNTVDILDIEYSDIYSYYSN